MKLSRNFTFALLPTLAIALLGTPGAAALDAPHTFHRSHTAEPHLTESRHHRAAATPSARAIPHTAPHTASRAAAPAAKPTSTRASKRHPATSPAPAPTAARLSRRGRARAGAAGQATLRRASLSIGRHHSYERFTANSFATSDIFAGDVTTGEDPIVRQAAVDALGDMNGTAVVINPANGRILAMVNQKLALSPGAEPCSTIKITVAMAALSEGIVNRDTMVQLPGFRMNMTDALAHSNNLYFEELGRELGFDRVRHYAKLFGLGELAGYNIPGEQLGVYPDQPIAESEGGVGKMCSFGQGVSLTPLQLGAYVASLANGGTLFYLQHPTTMQDIAEFQPRVKRILNIAKYVPEMQDGMAGAVEFGTARRLRANFHDFPVFGKTGTCSDNGTRFGWFASYTDSPQGKLVTVFFLEGGRATFGPRAAELTGEFYKNLADRNYFGDKGLQTAQTVTVSLDPQLSAQQSFRQALPR